MRTKLALVAAVVLGFLAAIGVRSYVTQKVDAVKGTAKRSKIAVARVRLNPGELLEGHKVGFHEVETLAVAHVHILESEVKSFLGHPVTQRVEAGSPLLKDHFLVAREEEEFHGRRIDTRMRAKTVGTDQIAGVAGLIMPGSRVDILVTLRMPGRGPGSGPTVVTKVIARNVQVLAVDNRTAIQVPLRPGRRQRFERAYSSVTIHVTPLEAALLTFAEQAGKISFSLRNVNDSALDRVPDITLPEFDALAAEAARKRAEATRDRLRTPTPP